MQFIVFDYIGRSIADFADCMGSAVRFPSLTKVLTKASKAKTVGTKLGLAFCGYYTFTSQVP